jgi:hypothetical protein
MEYLMVVALLFMLLIPGISLYYTYSQSSLAEISATKTSDIGNSIINNAENSYYLGQGSRITLDVTMPQNVRNMTIQCDYAKKYCELVLKVDTNELAFSTTVPLKRKSVSLADNYQFPPEAYSAGIKRIIIETFDYVEIDVQ